MCTNNAFPVEDGDRRIGEFKVSDKYAQSTDDKSQAAQECHDNIDKVCMREGNADRFYTWLRSHVPAELIVNLDDIPATEVTVSEMQKSRQMGPYGFFHEFFVECVNSIHCNALHRVDKDANVAVYIFFEDLMTIYQDYQKASGLKAEGKVKFGADVKKNLEKVGLEFVGSGASSTVVMPKHLGGKKAGGYKLSSVLCDRLRVKIPVTLNGVSPGGFKKTDELFSECTVSEWISSSPKQTDWI